MSERVNVQSVLQRLDDASSRTQFEQFKLGAECLGVPRGIIETAKSFSDVCCQLNNHVAKGDGCTWSYALLNVIGVVHEELQALAPCINEESLQRCERNKTFHFAVMIIRVCNFLGEDDYKKLFGLCQTNLQQLLNFEKLPIIELFLSELIKQKIISVTNVKVLDDKLEIMGHIQAKEVVQKYREMIGKLGQETQQGGSCSGSSQAEAEGCITAVQEKGEPATAIHQAPGSHDQDLSDTEKDGAQPFSDNRDDSGNSTNSSLDPKQHLHQGKEKNKRSGQGNDEKTPLLVGNKDSSPVFSVHCKVKNMSCRLCCGATSLIAVLALTLALTGGFGWNSVSINISQNRVDVTKFAVRNETLFLGKVDASWVSNATVSECTQYGDSSHISYVYVVDQEDLKMYTVSKEDRLHTRHELRPSKTTYLLRDYFWDGSSFNLSFYAMNPAGSTGIGYVHIFNDEAQFENYKNGEPALPIISKKLNIGTLNVSEPTLFQYKVDQPSFYFVAVETPADVYYSYLFRSKKIYLDYTDYEKSCEQVYEGSPCFLKFTKAGRYFVLAYVKPLVEEGSFTTHLRLKTGIVQNTQQQIITYKCLTFGGLIVIGLFLLTFFICITYHSCRHKGEKNVVNAV